jgi:GTP pyrophosphokinase
VAVFYKLSSHLDLLYKIAVKNIDLKELKDFQVIGNRLEQPKPVVVEKVEPLVYDPQVKPLTKKDTELIIFGESSDQIQYELAKCCKPIPGDNVFGFITIGKGMVIHRVNCPNAPQLMANYGHRIVRTKWAKNKEISFLTGLKIIGMDDVGVINKITTIISGDMRINIAGLSIESDSGLFEGLIKIFVHDKEELEELVQRLKSLNGIQSVDRFDTEE